MSPDREAELEAKHKPTIWRDVGGKHYKQVLPVGSWKRPGCGHYAKWVPVKRRFKVFWVATGKPFWIEPWPSLRKVK